MKNKVNTFVRSRKGLYCLWGLLTIWGGMGVCYLFNMAGMAAQVDLLGFTQSALSPFAFILVGFFLKRLYERYLGITDKKQLKRRLVFSYGFSFLLSLSFILGYQMRIIGNTLPGFWGKGQIVFQSAGLGLAFLPLTNLWFEGLDKRRLTGEKPELSPKAKRRSFFISWGVIFVCWIPIFLAYYPAIMSYDFHRQSQEAYNWWFNSHHPLAHTYLIRVFLLLGERLGSYQVGMALFSLMQMLILSVVLAYSCSVVARMLRSVFPAVILTVVYALLPLHSVLVLCMTKDVLFSAFFLLLVLLMWEQRRFFTQVYTGSRRDNLKMAGFALAMVLTGILNILFRNNALHALAIFAVFYVLLSAGQRIYIGILCVCILAGGIGCKNGLLTALDAGEGSKMEMYSVFVQQFARVGRNQTQNLSEEEWDLIDHYVPADLWEGYNPVISDSIKGTIAVTSYLEWKDDIPQMLRDWAKIGVRYFNEYLDAFLAITSGYWFLDDVSHAEVLGYGDDTYLGLIYTFNVSQSDEFVGMETHSYLPALQSLCQRTINGNGYYEWPVLSLLFKPAFYCWLLFLVFCSAWYLRKPKKQLMCLFPLLYLLTLFLGPVVNIRYVYPIIIVVPVLAAHILSEGEHCREEGKG